MIKLIKKRKKNPNLVEYGYHFTRSTDIDSIMKQGLIPGFKINKNSTTRRRRCKNNQHRFDKTG